MYDVRDFLKDHRDLVEEENFADLLACCPKNIEWGLIHTLADAGVFTENWNSIKRAIDDLEQCVDVLAKSYCVPIKGKVYTRALDKVDTIEDFNKHIHILYRLFLYCTDSTSPQIMYENSSVLHFGECKFIQAGYTTIYLHKLLEGNFRDFLSDNALKTLMKNLADEYYAIKGAAND